MQFLVSVASGEMAFFFPHRSVKRPPFEPDKADVELARSKKLISRSVLPSKPPRRPPKAIADALGVAPSDLVVRLKTGVRAPGPYRGTQPGRVLRRGSSCRRRRPHDDDVLLRADPLARGQGPHEGLVDAARRLARDLLDHRRRIRLFTA
jgi:hypothetical protein